ncbi:MAG: type II toxin-antitoxin system VapC family toxin [PVC group bacterium]
MIVVDANTIIYLVRDTSFTPLAREVYAADPHWVAPPLWKPEVLNGLLREVKAGHIALEAAIEAANMASRVLLDRIQDCAPALILQTAEEAGLTAYDAYYVALARSLGIVLVTEDRRIKKNCPDVARSMKAFLGLPEKSSGVREKRAAYQTRRKKK